MTHTPDSPHPAAMTPRDCVTGDELTVTNDGHHIVVSADRVPTIYLTPSAALLLARRLTESVTPQESLDILGGDQ